uniref:CHR930 n=1 Tax=Arundo donax TaxID=35708 RepID=A0A0A9E7V3_ARUDO
MQSTKLMFIQSSTVFSMTLNTL